ncbi:MAG: arsenical resistance operon transcriptional repressor ArsD [Acidobacteria bacterium]|nr:MAG: arsenical resistance operon transcriptional repressor ArsD [Acidobacteriota bacterium]
MRPIQVFESAPYCSADASGIGADETLVNFAEDVDWCKKYGAKIERFNLAQHPMAFAQNPLVKAFLERSGQEGLPLFLVDGKEYLAGRYPNRCQLASWAQVAKFAVRPK